MEEKLLRASFSIFKTDRFCVFKVCGECDNGITSSIIRYRGFHENRSDLILNIVKPNPSTSHVCSSQEIMVKTLVLFHCKVGCC